MSVKRLLAIGFILGCTTGAWILLGTALQTRTRATDKRLAPEVVRNWGAPMIQAHPTFYYIAPTSDRGRRVIQPTRSRVNVDLRYDPKTKGLLWYRTYQVDFSAEYVLRNPTPITQTFYADFRFPAEGIRYDKFSFRVGDTDSVKPVLNGRVTESVILKPGEEVPVRFTYWAAGIDRWDYSLADSPRVREFVLTMKTDFKKIDMPPGAQSPTSRESTADGWLLVWDYSDVIGARAIGMDMPGALNAGPVAARIAFFAPVSLLFYFAVLVILSMVRRVNLHPMNYFFLAAGCFAFQLLFAYLVDLIPITMAFLMAAFVSLALVTVYLWRVAGGGFARLSAIAQTAYMVMFSYSFFFRGLTGITITVGAIVTLAILMAFTAKLNWEDAFSSGDRATAPDPSTGKTAQA